jgi:hypothetical protein
MTDRPYQVNKTGTTPALLGRERLFEVLYRQLTKGTPDHVTVVGPRLFGKTVLLNHLAQHVRPGRDGYLTSVYWDLGHGSPATDQEFYNCLAKLIKTALEGVQEPLAVEIDPAKGKQDLDDVFDLLVLENKRLLVIMDGFDRVLSVTGLTRNLWDGLKALGDKKSLWFVTGSRKRLRELCKTEASQTSDFWEIFNPNPTRVGRLEEHDWDGFLLPFTSRRVTFDGSARKELQNWTGGVPVLAAALLASLHEGTREGATVTKSEVDSAANEALGGYGDWLDELWEDCTAEMQAGLVDLFRCERPASEFSGERGKELEHRGLSYSHGNKVYSGCKMMSQHANKYTTEVADMQRLFGTADRFRENIRRLLETRRMQVVAIDTRLGGAVVKAIRELTEPEDAIVWARSIAEIALDLLWAKELTTSMTLPDDWVRNLQHAGERPPDEGKIPPKRGAQCGVLRLITGTDKIHRLSRYVSKATYTLVDHIQSIGDLGQHRQGEVITWSYAASFCFAAAELLDSMHRDFSR